jgi:hypothetical protein
VEKWSKSRRQIEEVSQNGTRRLAPWIRINLGQTLAQEERDQRVMIAGASTVSKHGFKVMIYYERAT